MKAFNVILEIYALFYSLYCIFWPEESVLGLGWTVAGLLALWGISSTAEYFISHKANKGLKANGSIGLILGIAAMVVSVIAMTSDILATVFTMQIAVMAPVMCLIGMIMAIRTSAALSSTLVVAIPLLAVVLVIIGKLAIPLSTSIQKKLDRINMVIREKLSGVRVIRAFARSILKTNVSTRSTATIQKTVSD